MRHSVLLEIDFPVLGSYKKARAELEEWLRTRVGPENIKHISALADDEEAYVSYRRGRSTVGTDGNSGGKAGKG